MKKYFIALIALLTILPAHSVAPNRDTSAVHLAWRLQIDIVQATHFVLF